jgi:hypothetical protein
MVLEGDTTMTEPGQEPHKLNPLMVPVDKIMDFTKSILHGDEKHQQWLIGEAHRFMGALHPIKAPVSENDPILFPPLGKDIDLKD